MAEYSSTKAGFQRAMEWSLTGSAEDAKSYAEATSVPGFYHVMNGKRSGLNEYVKHIAEHRGRVSDYKPVVHEFLRDGDQLAARLTGTIKLSGTNTEFESFIFGKVDKATGKMEWIIERSMWGAK